MSNYGYRGGEQDISSRALLNNEYSIIDIK